MRVRASELWAEATCLIWLMFGSSVLRGSGFEGPQDPGCDTPPLGQYLGPIPDWQEAGEVGTQSQPNDPIPVEITANRVSRTASLITNENILVLVNKQLTVYSLRKKKDVWKEGGTVKEGGVSEC